MKEEGFYASVLIELVTCIIVVLYFRYNLGPIKTCQN